MGEGWYGKVVACQDLTLQTMFAMKIYNQSTDDMVKCMERQCTLLHYVGHHKNIIQIFGAVIDDEVTACNTPQRSLKLMMELADCEGCLSFIECTYFASFSILYRWKHQ